MHYLRRAKRPNSPAKPSLFPPDRFTMLRAYQGANGMRCVHHKGLTFEQCQDLDLYPGGVHRDARGEFIYTHVLTECLNPSNYL